MTEAEFMQQIIDLAPVEGDLKRSSDLGLKGKAIMMWHHCVICGKGRWVIKRNDRNWDRCHSCAQYKESATGWKGGRFITYRGYVWIWVDNKDFFFPMARKKSGRNTAYIPEHRLVMAKHLGRNLQVWEHVHHKNGVKTDNRIENLELTTNGQHSIDHNKGYRDGYAKGLVDGRDKQIRELLIRIESLEKQIKIV